jgi:hypothetical protein
MRGQLRLFWLVASASLWLAACAGSEHETGEHEHGFVGDSTFVIIEDGGDEAHAAPQAKQYCAQYGKAARLKLLKIHRHGRYARGVDVEFDCVD